LRREQFNVTAPFKPGLLPLGVPARRRNLLACDGRNQLDVTGANSKRFRHNYTFPRIKDWERLVVI
jgi:hypothetical protein